MEDPQKHQYYYSNAKYYLAARKTYRLQNNWLEKNCKGKKVLVLGCGDGAEAFFLAKIGAEVVGIDISDVSIEKANKSVKASGLSKKVGFLVMDAENLSFPDSSFDFVTASGMLHHTDFKETISEMARVLKPGGQAFCIEPLAYNPVFQLYRKLTPHLRTQWEAEHILSKKELKEASNYFGKIEKRFFHLFTLASVPFRNTLIFRPLLWILERIDGLVLKLPLIKWWAWQIVFILSKPKK